MRKHIPEVGDLLYHTQSKAYVQVIRLINDSFEVGGDWWFTYHVWSFDVQKILVLSLNDATLKAGLGWQIVQKTESPNRAT